MNETANILRHQAREGNVFDKSNDTVVITRTLLTTAADEIERLTAELERAEHAVSTAAIAAADAARAAASKCSTCGTPLGSTCPTCQRLLET